ncbi:MAG TPA: hypothetical protein VFX50_03480 [Gemmatimonadales bacterium]|nr:hypothetical protein [Gemmatimonadales bacterium]
MHRLPLAAAAALALASPVLAQKPALPTAPVREWMTPWPDAFIRDPMADNQGRVWFCGMNGNFIGLLDPASGQFKRFDLEEGAHPHSVIVDGQGRAWYTGNRNGTLGRIDPVTGKITTYKLPEGLKDPHTLVTDSRGDIWFTVQGGNAVGKLNTKTGEFRIVRMPTANSRPYGIVVDDTDRPWIAEFGTNKVGTVDPVTFALKEYTLPNAGSRPRRIAVTPDRKVWVDDYPRGMLIRLDPLNGETSEYALPGGSGSLPYAMTADHRGRLWVAETGTRPNQISAFDPTTSSVVNVTPVTESGGISIRHMTFDPKTKLVWFATDAGTVGKLDAGKAGEVMRP